MNDQHRGLKPELTAEANEEEKSNGIIYDIISIFTSAAKQLEVLVQTCIPPVIATGALVDVCLMLYYNIESLHRTLQHMA